MDACEKPSILREAASMADFFIPHNIESMEPDDDCDVAALRAQLEQARQTGDYWKAEHLAGNEISPASAPGLRRRGIGRGVLQKQNSTQCLLVK